MGLHQTMGKKFPLPIGERRKVRGTRVYGNYSETRENREISEPPHPYPLPGGEREKN